MFFSSWLQKPKPVSTHNRRGPVRYRPTIDLLEDRLAPATLTVSPMALDGTQHSLRGVLASLNPNEANTVILTPGTLRLTQGELQIPGMSDLTIRSLRAGSVTIDGGGLSRDFAIESSSVTLSGLTITGGNAGDGGGIRAGYGSTVTIVGSTISGNSAAFSGGGIGAEYGSTVTIVGSTISGNSAFNGGGIFTSGSMFITSSTLAQNAAREDGGGVWAGSGGAVTGDAVTITGSTVSGNSAGGGGGGIKVFNGTVTINSSTVAGNSAGSRGAGGGIAAVFSTVTVTATTVSANSAVNFGGGIEAAFCTVTISSSTVSGNSAGTNGGGIWVENSTVTITSSTITANQAQVGGGVYNLASSVFLDAATFAALFGNFAVISDPNIFGPFTVL